MSMRVVLAVCVGLVGSAGALAQPGGRFQAERESAFETRLIERAEADDGLQMDIKAGPAGNNARGLVLSGGNAAVVGLDVSGRKYGVSLDGTGDVLIKDFVFTDRQAKDIFGAGVILGQKTPTRGETWLSNAWIDLKGRGPIADYKAANNEAISVEKGNGRLNVRRAVLVGGEESGLDNKGDVRMDGVFIASGHRSVRVWGEARVVIANSIVLANPGHTAIWFGGEGEARFEYYNCLFGEVGDRWEDLSRDPPESLVQIDDDLRVRMRRLDSDPFDRGRGSFWMPTEAPVPAGYLRGRRE
jgi:hypothetical protein